MNIGNQMFDHHFMPRFPQHYGSTSLNWVKSPYPPYPIVNPTIPPSFFDDFSVDDSSKRDKTVDSYDHFFYLIYLSLVDNYSYMPVLKLLIYSFDI